MKKQVEYEFTITSNKPSKEAINDFAMGLLILYNDKTDQETEEEAA